MLEKRRERIYAIQNVKKIHEQRMEKVYATDEEFLQKWNTPDIPLTEDQLQQVEAFWGKYSFAYQNDPRVQAHYTSVSGRFDPRYCSPGLITYYLYRFYDDPNYHTAFHDKNYREFLFKDFPCTKAVIHRVRGLYYDKDFRSISYNAAMSTLSQLLQNDAERLIVKPTPGGSGNGIQFIRKGDSVETISSVLDSIKDDDLIVERFLGSHPSYAAANPTSLNSLRIVTFLYENEFSVIAILFRMGAPDKEVDNFSQDGIACGVTEDGICMDFGFDQFGQRYDRHPSGFEFAGHRLYGVDKAVDMVGRLHRRVPQFKQMSWDIAIDEAGTPTLIEMNPRGGVNIYQSIGALPFGEKTEQILDEYLITRFYKPGANRSWDYREYSDHVVLTGCALDRKTVKVPEQINGKFVTHISAGCFTGSKIREIIIPGCVKSIEDGVCADGINAHITCLPDQRGINPPESAVVRGEVNLGRNILRWEPVENATHYQIYRMKQGGVRVCIKVVSSVTTSFTDYDVLEGVVYYYYVRSHNSKYNMQSEWGDPVALKAGIEMPVPTDLRVEVLSRQNDLSWVPTGGATHYHIYRKLQGGDAELLRTIPAREPAFCDRDIQNGTHYTYFVRSYNARYATMSEPSEEVSVTGKIEIPAPASIRGKVASGRNNLSWEPVEGATHYYVYRMQQGGDREHIQTLPAQTTSYVDRNVLNGRLYYYYVRSHNSEHDIISEWSEPTAIQAQVQIQPPAALRGKVAAGENRLSWEPVGDATHYYVYRMQQGGARTFLRSVPADTTSFVDRDVQADAVYYYYVRSHNSKHNIVSSWSESVAIRAIQVL